MHPGFISHWKRRRCGESPVEMGAGSSGYGHGYGRSPRGWEYAAAPEDSEPGFGPEGGAFGVRRPLRFLAYKLELSEAQVAELARILDAIKTERAQAAVDRRRTLSSFAQALEGASFDRAKADEGASLRLQSAEQLKGAVVTALEGMHKLLEPEQRERLAYLIRTGTLSI